MTLKVTLGLMRKLSATMWPGGLPQEDPQEKFPSRTSKATERTCFSKQSPFQQTEEKPAVNGLERNEGSCCV